MKSGLISTAATASACLILLPVWEYFKLKEEGNRKNHWKENELTRREESVAAMKGMKYCKYWSIDTKKTMWQAGLGHQSSVLKLFLGSSCYMQLDYITFYWNGDIL